MSFSLFFTSNTFKNNNAGILNNAFNFFKNKHNTTVFKIIVKDDQLNNTFENYDINNNLKEFYGFKESEILKQLAEDKNSPIILETIIEKFTNLKSKYDFIIIDAFYENFPLDGFLSSLFCQVAANIASPVLILFNNEIKEDVLSATVEYFEDGTDVLAAISLTNERVKVNLKQAKFSTLKTEDDLAVELEKLYDDIKKYESTFMPPLRFESLIVEKAKSNLKRIVLPEGTDDRILIAANNVIKRGFAKIIILGDPESIKKRCQELGLEHTVKAEIIKISEYKDYDFLVNEYYELRKSKGVTPEKAKEQLQDINFFATMLIKTNRADGMVSGAIGSTADTIRPALSIIKTQKDFSIASSIFFMCLKDQVVIFGDCAINVNPSPEQIAEIALSSAVTAKYFGIEPKVAMLSYSTGKSGAGPDVETVSKATDLAIEAAKTKIPQLKLDGPIQFDAAFDVATAKTKAPNSPLAGKATVLIFPDLNSGNIAYKAVQRTANAVAIGPILQGLNAPVNDLSRGSLVKDIINTIAITAIQCGN